MMRSQEVTWPTVLGSMLTALFAIGIQTTRADEVLDQSFIPQLANLSAAVNQGMDSAQTFTVGISETLTRIEVFIYRFGNDEGTLFVDVRPTVDGSPVADDSQALASAAIPVNAVPIFPPCLH